MTAAVFAAAFAALLAGHHVGDYWVQTNHQAMTKGQPGWAGRRACGGHVATYTAALAVCLAMATWSLSLPLSVPWAAAGLAVSAVTHYFADRRRPLEKVAGLIPGKIGFYRSGTGLASGAAYLDQSWHMWWLFVSALIIAGGMS